MRISHRLLLRFFCSQEVWRTPYLTNPLPNCEILFLGSWISWVLSLLTRTSSHISIQDRFTRIELPELLSHPFLSNEFFTKPLYYGTPDFPIQQLPAPPISRPPGRGPPSIVSQRYPPYLSKVEPPKGVFNILGPAPVQKTAQPSRNFLSDNWKPQADAHVLGRRIVSLPPASSSSFTSLKLEDRQTRQTTPPGSQALDSSADVPAATGDSALVVPSHLGSGSGSNSGYNAGSDDSDSTLR